MPRMTINLKYNKSFFDSRAVGIDLKEIPVEAEDINGKTVEYFTTEELGTLEDYHLTVWFQSNTENKKFTCEMVAPEGHVLRFYDEPSKGFKTRDISWPTLTNKKRRLVVKRFYLEEE